MTIIGVTGYKRSGKDTVAKVFVNSYGFKKYEFARPMKEACAVIFGWGDAELYGDKKEIVDPRWGISPRQALQHIGTEWAQLELCAEFPEFAEVTGRLLWVKRFELEVLNYGPRENWVISDVRFPHEVERLRLFRDSVIIRVLRPDLVHDDTHDSEHYYDKLKADFTIVNDGTLMDLHHKTIELAQEILA